MLAEDDYGEFFNKKLHKYAHDIKGMHLELSQQLFNCDGVKGGFWWRQENYWWNLWYEDVEEKDERKKLKR